MHRVTSAAFVRSHFWRNSVKTQQVCCMPSFAPRYENALTSRTERDLSSVGCLVQLVPLCDATARVRTTAAKMTVNRFILEVSVFMPSNALASDALYRFRNAV